MSNSEKSEAEGMERVTTLHPQPGKLGTSIEAAKYHQVRDAIHKVLDEQGDLSFTELTEEVASELGSTFDGSIPWYVTTVKLDLEARREITCNRGGKRQIISRPNTV